jgi:hypothetical protein
MAPRKYEPVTTRPVKRFFVNMLTRDIELEDAILDLLDNCVDGVLRSLNGEGERGTPYKGYSAKISFDASHFDIKDNCGGIPWDLHDSAFRMGRPENGNEPEPALTVGVYGIGMKRAIFKMGRVASIWTQNGKDNYKVSIPTGWMADEEDWELKVSAETKKMRRDGTRINITDLEEGASARFAAKSFEEDLLDKIESHYSVIMHKGLRVEVNGKEANPKPLLLRFATGESDGPEIRPYVFRTEVSGVTVILAVGLREPIPDADTTLEEQNETQFSSDYAGWTVICNDRVVLYCNRDELTGWGTAKLPRYHNQFIAISGVVEFRGDPRRLPTTTTKRGLNFSSPLYQNVLDRMRDGLRLFIDYTNRWKSRSAEAKVEVDRVPALTFENLKGQIETLKFTKVTVGLEGEQYKPKLPRPVDDSPDVRISYFRDRDQVAALAGAMLEDVELMTDREIRKGVGEASFEFAFSQKVNGRVRRRTRS